MNTSLNICVKSREFSAEEIAIYFLECKIARCKLVDNIIYFPFTEAFLSSANSQIGPGKEFWRDGAK